MKFFTKNIFNQEKQISFYHEKESVVDLFPPVPAKKMIPDWYKDLELFNDEHPTIKNCIPVRDILTSGYYLLNSFETELKSEYNQDLDKFECPFKTNMKGYVSHHHFKQFPIQTSGMQQDYFKINHGWTIKTPSEYSCLIMHPFFHNSSEWQILTAIVDTDKYPQSISLPGFKKNTEHIIIEPGVPIAHVIPFKRESWVQNIECKSENRIFDFFIKRQIDKVYKNLFHCRKKFR